MRIVQVVVKNTSTLDYTLPVIRHLATRGESLAVVYCTLDRRRILRRSKFYSWAIASVGGTELDYLDFTRPWAKPFVGLLRRLFSISHVDRLYLRELHAAYKTDHQSKGLVPFLFYILGTQGIRAVARSLVGAAISRLERLATSWFVNLQLLWRSLDSDIILFDNRNTKDFVGWKELLSHVHHNKPRVVLLPHAPHYRTPTGEFCAFLEENPHPAFCEHWSPMKYGRAEDAAGADPKRIAHIGYPGLDSDWLNEMRRGSLGSVTSRKLRPVSCLFIARRYLPEGVRRPPDLDPYILDFEDFALSLRGLVQGIGTREVEVVVKPHPSNDYRNLARDLMKSGIRRWRISCEPVYAELSTTDLVVSLFSTILLVPAMAGIPTLVAETGLQRHAHAQWPLLEGLYRGLDYYVDSLERIPSVIEQILSTLPSKSARQEGHLRQYFPDGATRRAVDRIRSLAGNGPEFYATGE